MEIPRGPSQISQVALVVHDLDETMRTYHETLGWGPWKIYELGPPEMHSMTLHGQPVQFSMLVAQCEVPPGVVIELVQPLDGPSAYKEWLDEHGEGVQHIACRTTAQREADEFNEQMAERGIDALMTGRIGQTIEFSYLDTQPLLKFILETGSGDESEVAPNRTYPSPP
ncbi:MAG: VOC family protein [Acidimicrobiia bacterium]|nr:VOC family protein [Acidimicrobiia bacterium]MDQ3499396.1 VOC family protein [Actinomycetota bacterium]